MSQGLQTELTKGSSRLNIQFVGRRAVIRIFRKGRYVTKANRSMPEWWALRERKLAEGYIQSDYTSES
jgi:hypothetical protein